MQEVVGEFDARRCRQEALGSRCIGLKVVWAFEWRDLFIGFIPAHATDELALDTVSGLVISLLERIPQVGDRVRLGNPLPLSSSFKSYWSVYWN